MTAIAGFWSFRDSAPAAACARLLAPQKMYGPDDEAQRVDGAIAMGRALHRLLPEDRFDRGPVVARGGRRMLVADVRLDNRDELAAALDLAPERSRETSDAALLMEALERWEEGALDRLVGEFAFARWDAEAETLLLARDFLGNRPLHFHRAPGFFAFASMAKGLHALADVPRGPNLARVADFLALMPEAGTDSYFEGISRVPAGHFAIVGRDGETLRRWWQPRRTTLKLARDEDYAEGLRAHMEIAVKACLRGAGDAVASHLSGGLDSSSVTATAARLFAPGRVVAFTHVPSVETPVMPGRFADEGPHAAAVAALHPNIEHVRIPNGGSPLDGLERSMLLYDRPMLNLCNMRWGDAINDGARERGIKVMLNGQLGNMTISYGAMPHLAHLLGRGRLIRLARLSLGLRRHGLRWRGIGAAAVGPYLPRPLWRWINSRLAGRSYDFSSYTSISPEAMERYRVVERAAELGLDPSYRPWLDGFAMRLWVLGRIDMGVYAKGVLGGWGIDYRDPTADRRLVEYCLAVPDEQYILKGQARSLARRAFADRLPGVVLNESRKGLQAADWWVGFSGARDAIADEVERNAEHASAAGLLRDFRTCTPRSTLCRRRVGTAPKSSSATGSPSCAAFPPAISSARLRARTAERGPGR